MWLRVIEGQTGAIPKRVFLKLVQEVSRDGIVHWHDDTPWVMDCYARLIDWPRLLNSSPEMGREDGKPDVHNSRRVRWWLEGYTESH